MSDNTSTEGQQDVFDDSAAETGSDTGSEVNDAGDAGEGEGTEGAQTSDKQPPADEKDQTGAKKATGTPPADEDDPEAVTDEQTGKKFIPEHRFKAALKKVTDELEAKNAKLAEYEKPEPIPVPDKATDPEGHALHTRMEASKLVMMDLRPDYQEKINHFAVMAESNPLLNQAVSEHPIPAKLAYDIAAKDLEIKEALALKNSDEWKEFQEYKKNKAAGAATKTPEDTKLGKTIVNGLTPRTVPNLNRSTNASPNRNVRKVSNGDNDDDLFAGAL